MSRITISFFLLFVGCSAIAASSADFQECGSLKNHYGPKDYRTTGEAGREVVESAHFTPKVESLQGGKSSITAGGDLNYLLRVFPNHPRGLMAMMKLAQKEKGDKPIGSEYTVACWFERGERFQPNDGTVKMLHGFFLLSKGKPQEAIAKLESALELAGDSGNLHYNIGLAYFQMGQHDKALQSAHRAYGLNFELPGLREKLKRVGKWQDPPPKASAAPAPEAAESGALSEPKATPAAGDGQPK